MITALVLGALLGLGAGAAIMASGISAHLAAMQAEDERWLQIAKREAELAKARAAHEVRCRD